MATYKDLTNQLEELLEKLESGDLDLDEAVKTYESATKLVAEMEKYLLTTKNKIKKIDASIRIDE